MASVFFEKKSRPSDPNGNGRLLGSGSVDVEAVEEAVNDGAGKKAKGCHYDECGNKRIEARKDFECV